METSILSKDMFIEMIKGMKNSEIAFVSNIIQGGIHGTTKKKLKNISFGFTSDCFQNPETIGDILNSKLFGVIIMEKKLMNQETLKRFKDSQKKNNTTNKDIEPKANPWVDRRIQTTENTKNNTTKKGGETKNGRK